MVGGLGPEDDYYHIVNFDEATGDRPIDATSNKIIFVAPDVCEILDISLAVTTAVAAHATNVWTIDIANQTGDVALLSTNFDTDADNTGNGGRSLTADALNSLTYLSGTKYLQNAVLAKGDMLLMTATRATTPTDLVNPVVVVKYRM